VSPITTSVDTLYNLARDILESANQALLDNDLDPPNHQFVSWNAPAWDCCDHLTTHLENLKPDQATANAQQSRNSRICAQRFDATIVLTLINCVPLTNDVMPPDDEMDVSAHGFLQRAWVLYQALTCDYDVGVLLPDFPGCKIVKINPLTPHGPQGGCASFTMSFTVELS
jgi:hypothetical protein